MKHFFISSLCLIAVSGFAQIDLNKGSIFNKAKDALGNNASTGKATSLSSEDIISGLKEALTVGTNKSTSRLSAVDGFFKDAAVKILLPPEAQKVEKSLRSVGMGKLVDDAILSLNRAAEDASQKAAPIFVSAIKKMTITDGLNILKGTDTAATHYLKDATSKELTDAFKPVIDSSLKKTDATKYWKEVFDNYNKLPFVKKVDPDISSYVTGKTLSGIFYYVAEEEKKIRKDPAARVNDILKNVFGNK
jgi:hypothetical protein